MNLQGSMSVVNSVSRPQMVQNDGEMWKHEQRGDLGALDPFQPESRRKRNYSPKATSVWSAAGAKDRTVSRKTS